MNHDKASLRQRARKIRAKLPLETISAEIVNQLKELPVFQQARLVLAYYPMPGEVDLRTLWEEPVSTRQWALPRCEGKTLVWHFHSAEHSLTQTRPGLYEPLSTTPLLCTLDAVDLILVPSLAFDSDGYRLGYGKGYYDRFFAQNPDLLCKAMGISPAALLLKTPLPRDPWDLPLNSILTEAGLQN